MDRSRTISVGEWWWECFWQLKMRSLSLALPTSRSFTFSFASQSFKKTPNHLHHQFGNMFYPLYRQPAKNRHVYSWTLENFHNLEKLRKSSFHQIDCCGKHFTLCLAARWDIEDRGGWQETWRKEKDKYKRNTKRYRLNQPNIFIKARSLRDFTRPGLIVKSPMITSTVSIQLWTVQYHNTIEHHICEKQFLTNKHQ